MKITKKALAENKSHAMECVKNFRENIQGVVGEVYRLEKNIKTALNTNDTALLESAHKSLQKIDSEIQNTLWCSLYEASSSIRKCLESMASAG